MIKKTEISRENLFIEEYPQLRAKMYYKYAPLD